jgi:hypothetical protein
MASVGTVFVTRGLDCLGRGKLLVILTRGPQKTPEVTKTVLSKIILNVWIENGPVLLHGPVI